MSAISPNMFVGCCWLVFFDNIFRFLGNQPFEFWTLSLCFATYGGGIVRNVACSLGVKFRIEKDAHQFLKHINLRSGHPRNLTHPVTHCDDVPIRFSRNSSNIVLYTCTCSSCDRHSAGAVECTVHSVFPQDIQHVGVEISRVLMFRNTIPTQS